MSLSLSISMSLKEAAEQGNLGQVKQAILVSTKEERTDALKWAAENGHVDVVELSLPISDPKADNSLTLMWAAESGQVSVVELLLPVCDPKANDSWALQIAAKNGHISVVKLLLPVSDPKTDNSLALQGAAESGHADVVELLIPVSDPATNNSLALQWAARNDHVEVIKLLLPVSDVIAAAKNLVKNSQWEALDRLGLELPLGQQQTFISMAPVGQLPQLEAYLLAQRRKEILEVKEPAEPPRNRVSYRARS